MCLEFHFNLAQRRPSGEPVLQRMKIAKSERLAVGLLQAQMPLPKSVRLLGISLSSPQTTAAEWLEPGLTCRSEAP
jgi:hypothetical protein